MSLIDKLAEKHIQLAIERGDLQGLPGEGHPQQLDDDALIPQELRAAYRLLKNSGYLPPELQLLSELRDVEALLRVVQTDEQRSDYQKKINLLRMQLSMQGNRSAVWTEGFYQAKLQDKLDK